MLSESQSQPWSVKDWCPTKAPLKRRWYLQIFLYYLRVTLGTRSQPPRPLQKFAWPLFLNQNHLSFPNPQHSHVIYTPLSLQCRNLAKLPPPTILEFIISQSKMYQGILNKNLKLFPNIVTKHQKRGVRLFIPCWLKHRFL